MTNDQLPAPFVPGDVDLRDFAFMPLEIDRLRRSKSWLVAKRKPEVGFYMTNVWMGVWHNLPAGSVEDDDDVIADMAMCNPERWAEVKADVLRGWVKCSDGRLYHPVVAEKVMEAWARKSDFRVRMLKPRMAKLRKKLNRESDQLERARVEAQLRRLEEEYRRHYQAAGTNGLGETVDDADDADADEETDAAAETEAVPKPATEPVSAPATRLKRQGERQGESPPKPPKPKIARATPAAVAVVDAFVSAKNARWPESVDQIAPRMTLETLAQQHLDDGGTVELLTEVIQIGVRGWKNPTPPKSLAALGDSLRDRVAAFKRAAEGGGQRAAPANDVPLRPFDPHEQIRVRLRSFVQTGEWKTQWGPEPGHPMCQIPKAVVLEEIPGFKPGWRPAGAKPTSGAA